MGVSVHFGSDPNVTKTLTLVQGLTATIFNQQAIIVALQNSLARIEGKVDQLIMDEKLVQAALAQIDADTTKIAGNLSIIATTQGQIGTVVGTISTEVDSLVAGLQSAGVSQALIDQATALGTKADAAAAASDTISKATTDLVPVLQSIASKGVSNPTPTPVPPPPAPPPVG